jgi:hypothetical protein
MPVLAGILAGSVVLVAVYIGINRFGVRLPLKPFFAFTSAFLYYMAFVFAGKGIAELQEGGLISTTILPWAPRVPPLGIYPTAESLAAQGLLVLLAIVALVWNFVLEPRRARRRAALATRESVSARASASPDTMPSDAAPLALAHSSMVELLRSLERMEADLAEMRAEVERMRRHLLASRPATTR